MLEGQNYLSQMGRFDVYKKNVLITSLFPEKENIILADKSQLKQLFTRPC